MNKDIVKCAVKCLTKLKIEDTTNSIARDIVIEEYEESVKEIERLNKEKEDLQKRLNSLLEAHKICDEQNIEYTTRIDKALEEINVFNIALLSDINSCVAYKIEKVKKILQGSDKE